MGFGVEAQRTCSHSPRKTEVDNKKAKLQNQWYCIA